MLSDQRVPWRGCCEAERARRWRLELGVWALLLPALKAEKEENKEVSGWTRVLIKKQGHDGARGEMRRTDDGGWQNTGSSELFTVQLRGVESNVSSGCSASYSQFRKYIIITTQLSSTRCYLTFSPAPRMGARRLMLLENDRASSPLSVVVCMSGSPWSNLRVWIFFCHQIRSKRLTMPALTCKNAYGPTLFNYVVNVHDTTRSVR